MPPQVASVSVETRTAPTTVSKTLNTTSKDADFLSALQLARTSNTTPAATAPQPAPAAKPARSAGASRSGKSSKASKPAHADQSQPADNTQPAPRTDDHTVADDANPAATDQPSTDETTPADQGDEVTEKTGETPDPTLAAELAASAAMPMQRPIEKPVESTGSAENAPSDPQIQLDVTTAGKAESALPPELQKAITAPRGQVDRPSADSTAAGNSAPAQPTVTPLFNDASQSQSQPQPQSQPHGNPDQSNSNGLSTQPVAQAAANEESAATLPEPAVASSGKPAEAAKPETTAQDLAATLSAGAAKPQSTAAASAPAAPAQPPVPSFSEANLPRIVTHVRSELLPNGGKMQIRLDPPELGALEVLVQMRDGVMSASFQTSNEQATQLLSHSLSQLRNALVSQGVTVEKLHVEQAPRQQQGGTQDQPQQRQAFDGNAAGQEQQRRQKLQQLWNRAVLGRDPVDVIV